MSIFDDMQRLYAMQNPEMQQGPMSPVDYMQNMDPVLRNLIMQQQAEEQEQQPQQQGQHGIHQGGGMVQAPMMSQQAPQEQQAQAMQQGGQQPQQQEEPLSPLMAGSRAAVDAAKRSLSMDENENQRALGNAMMSFFSNVAQHPSYGKGGGNLGAISASIAPAVNAYDDEKNRIASMNHALQLEQKKEALAAQKEAREIAKQAHEMAMDERKVKVYEGELGIKSKEKEDELKEHEMLSKAGGSVPIHLLSPSNQNAANKMIDRQIQEGEAAGVALSELGEIKRIVTADPNITKKAVGVIIANLRNDPTLVNQRLAEIPNPVDRHNAELLGKHIYNYTTNKFKGMPAKGLNMQSERWIRAGTLDPFLSSESILNLADYDQHFIQHKYDYGNKTYEEAAQGNAWRAPPVPMHPRKEEKAESSDASGLTVEKKRARIDELLKMRPTAPEK